MSGLLDDMGHPGVLNRTCLDCAGPALGSPLEDSGIMLTLARNVDRRIEQCRVGPWGWLCATNQSANVQHQSAPFVFEQFQRSVEHPSAPRGKS